MSRKFRKFAIITISSLISLSGLSVAWAEDKAVSLPDIIPPKIKHEFTKAYLTEGDKAKVIATVTDNRGVASVTLYYRTKGTSEFNSMKMPRIGSDIYKVELSALKEPGLEYYIQASDVSNNTATKGSTHYPLVLNYKKQAAPIAATEPAKPASLKDTIEKQQEAKSSGTPTWVWVALGTLVTGGVAVALDSDGGGGGGGGPRNPGGTSITITTDLPE